MTRTHSSSAFGAALEAIAIAAVLGALTLGFGRAEGATEALGARTVNRGRNARGPGQIPLRGWKDILTRTGAAFNNDHIAVIAGGVTFNVLLAIVPSLAALVALYGLFGDVGQIPRQLRVLAVVLPHDVVNLIGGEMVSIARTRPDRLSFALVAGVAVSLVSVNAAMKAIFVGMNVAYEERETRGFIRLNLLSLAFSVCFIVFLAIALAALGAGTVVGAFLGPGAQLVANVVRWPILLAAFAGGLSLLYRLGPCRAHAGWRWITWGSAAATVIWLITSWLFSLYVSSFAHYDRTYGSLGTVIGLMVWIWLSSIVVLAGAELNAQIEHQAGDPAPAR